MIEGIGLSQTIRGAEVIKPGGNIKADGEYKDAAKLQKDSDSMMANLFNLDKNDRNRGGLPPAGSSIKTTA